MSVISYVSFVILVLNPKCVHENSLKSLNPNNYEPKLDQNYVTPKIMDQKNVQYWTRLMLVDHKIINHVLDQIYFTPTISTNLFPT
jgi:hypothetical protein